MAILFFCAGQGVGAAISLLELGVELIEHSMAVWKRTGIRFNPQVSTRKKEQG